MKNDVSQCGWIGVHQIRNFKIWSDLDPIRIPTFWMMPDLDQIQIRSRLWIWPDPAPTRSYVLV